MGQTWAETYPIARATFDEADEVLGFSLSQVCWSEGDSVNRTDMAQPGIFTTSVAIMRVLESLGQGPYQDRSSLAHCAGLSLGEYSALWFAGAFSFADGLRLVHLRGRAMQDAAGQVASGMVSLVGATLESATSLAEVGSAVGICQVANLNAPGQIILSGELCALERVAEVAKEHGVRRVRPLVVAGGFHSECMRPAADRLSEALEETPIEAPQIEVISNVDAQPVCSAEQVRSNLAQQVCAPVLWERSMRESLEQGVTQYTEPGPGTVLAGLMRKIAPEVAVRAMATPEDLSSPTVG